MEFVDLKKQQERIKPDLDRRIARVLEHGQYIMGPEVYELEEKLCELTGARYCVTCSSGTDALVLPLMAYNLEANDVVFVPSFTFAATAEAVVLAGGIPFFVDVDEKSFNICANSLITGVDEAKKQGYNIRGIIAVGLFGNPPSFDELRSICERHDLFLIDDAAQSLGSSYHRQRTGSIADVTATSFFPSKPLGCYGDGGAVFTNSKSLAEQLCSIRIHGKGHHKYDNHRIGLNARLDTLQAAILLAKLQLFTEEIFLRNRLAQLYTDGFKDILNVGTPRVSEGAFSAWAQYTITHPERDRAKELLSQSDIPSMIYYPKPMHKQVAYQSFPQLDCLGVSEYLSKSVLSLPIHSYLDKRSIKKVVGCFSSFD
jgi:dTDP-4-amino-4,6-dideoxygalactose transaminase